MIKEFQFYHGVVLARLLHDAKHVGSISLYPSSSNASYVINGNIGIYVKHSTARMSPWTFSFEKKHQDEILEMKNKLGKVFVTFVCRDDGIACLNFNELKQVLDHIHEDMPEWVRIQRRPREKYKIAGSDGVLKFKIGNNEFPSKLFF